MDDAGERVRGAELHEPVPEAHVGELDRRVDRLPRHAGELAAGLCGRGPRSRRSPPGPTTSRARLARAGGSAVSACRSASSSDTVLPPAAPIRNPTATATPTLTSSVRPGRARTRFHVTAGAAANRRPALSEGHASPRYEARTRSFARSASARVGERDLAGLEDVAVVGDLERHRRVLLDQEDGRPLLVDVDDHLEDALDEHRREPHRRLVEKQQARPGEQGAADCAHLLLAARERPRLLRAALGEAGKELVDPLEVGGDRRPCRRAGTRPSRGSRARSCARTAGGPRATGRCRASRSPGACAS